MLCEIHFSISRAIFVHIFLKKEKNDKTAYSDSVNCEFIFWSLIRRLKLWKNCESERKNKIIARKNLPNNFIPAVIFIFESFSLAPSFLTIKQNATMIEKFQFQFFFFFLVCCAGMAYHARRELFLPNLQYSLSFEYIQV